MQNIFGLTLLELDQLVLLEKLPRFTAKQIADWMYKKHVSAIDEMTNISAQNRNLLNEKYTILKNKHSNVQVSNDGTKKYLFPAANNKAIESAYIPDKDRATLCVSSQVGCKMGCLFCMTGKQGFQAHLTVGEIVNQVESLPERDLLTNIVYMGMGEPFDNIDNVLKSLEILTAEYGYNMSHKRITVSTVGIIPGMKQFLENSGCHLAVSLHSPFDEERRKLMPVQHVYPVNEVIKAIKDFDLGKQRRVSFEYIMFKGINDSPAHVKELTKILNGLDCRINLIKFHPVPNVPFESSDDTIIENFKEALNRKGIVTTLRASRGQDILAACGLLSTKELVNKL